MVITVCICLLFAACLYKIKFRVDDGSLGLDRDTTSMVKGIFSILIVLHHLSQRFSGRAFVAVTVLKYMGYPFVGVFFFISGFGLICSLDKGKPDRKFLLRRLLSLYIPYEVMNAIWIIYGVVAGHPYNLKSIVFSVLGGYSYTHLWYTTTLIVMTVAFVAIFSILREEKATKVMGMFILVYVVVCLVLRFQIAWTASIGCFYLGMIYKRKQAMIKVVLDRQYVPCLFGMLLVFGGTFAVRAIMQKIGLNSIVWQLFPRNIIAMSFSAATILALYKLRISNNILRWLGTISYEVYMVQFLVFEICIDYGINKANHEFYMIAVVAMVLVFSSLLHQLDSYVGLKIQKNII